ncbi:MAG: hypothetical protein HUJ55_05665 [Ileibacterium sp.]|nr:hypothetical protein [Ileibacterium sp.]
MKKNESKVPKCEVLDDLQIEELNTEIEIQLPDNYDKMDFADRLEYFWNLNEK